MRGEDPREDPTNDYNAVEGMPEGLAAVKAHDVAVDEDTAVTDDTKGSIDVDIEAIEMTGIVSKDETTEEQPDCLFRGKYSHTSYTDRLVWTCQMCTIVTSKPDEGGEHKRHHHRMWRWFKCKKCGKTWKTLEKTRKRDWEFDASLLIFLDSLFL